MKIHTFIATGAQRIYLLMLFAVLMLPISIMSFHCPSLKEIRSITYQWTIGDLKEIKCPRVISVPGVLVTCATPAFLGGMLVSTDITDFFANYLIGVAKTGCFYPSLHEKSARWQCEEAVKQYEEKITRLESQIHRNE